MHPSNSELVHAFPAVLRDDAVRAVAVLPENPHISQTFSVRVADEVIVLPYRIYHNPGLIDTASLSSIEKELVDCLLTRHHDGIVREQHLRRIICRDHIWVPPFVMQLVGEYVIEILQVIQHNLNVLNVSMYEQFLRTNPELLARTKQRVTSYWNCYYRSSSLLNSPELRFVCEMCDQALMKVRIGQVMRFGRDSSTSQPEGEDFEQGSAGSASGS